MSPRIFAVANQKGGVAKTTSTLSLGAGLSEEGYRVLLVDLDPQASLTYSLGVDPDSLEQSLHDVLLGRLPLKKVILETDEADLVPSNIDLAGAELFLFTKTGREYELQKALEEVQLDYDVILIDCPPSLGVLTINGLTAAHEVIIPFQCEALSQRGVAQLFDTINDVRRYTNGSLKIRGILPTMFDPRVTHSRKVLEEVSQRYAIPIFDPPVRKSVRFAEAPTRGRSLLKIASEPSGLGGVPPDRTEPDVTARPPDPQGKAVLFSGEPRSDGPFLLECARCGRNSKVGLMKILRSAMPLSITLPFRYHHTWMLCPACQHRGWVRIRPFS